MRDFIIRALGGIPREVYKERLGERQAVINRLRKDIHKINVRKYVNENTRVVKGNKER